MHCYKFDKQLETNHFDYSSSLGKKKKKERKTLIIE